MQQRWFDSDGLFVHTVEWEPDRPDPRAPAVVLVHGLGGSTISWELVGRELAHRLGARVTALDLPGFGKTRCQGQPASFEAHRHVVKTLLADRSPAIVAGNSMGGAIAVSLAARHPELVRALVLVNAAYPRPSRNFDQLTRTAKFAALSFPKAAAPVVGARARRLGPVGLVDASLLFVLSDPRRLDTELRDRLIDLATERQTYPEAAGAYAQSGGTLFRYIATRMRADLDAVQIPTLLIHGTRDRLVPVSFARAVAQRRTDWTYHELNDCGHAPQLEWPARFVESLSAWTDRELRDPAPLA